MAHITGIFAPDDPSQWPAIDESDPMLQRDLASLEMMGGEDMDHMNMNMDHEHPPQDGEHQLN
jgi:hypothetical protein